jgi:hypothetical protein
MRDRAARGTHAWRRAAVAPVSARGDIGGAGKPGIAVGEGRPARGAASPHPPPA